MSRRFDFKRLIRHISVASSALLCVSCISTTAPPPPTDTNLPSTSPLATPVIVANWPIQLTPGPECPGMLEDPESVAADVYSRIQDQQDVVPVLAALLPCLGVPVISSDSDDAVIGAFLGGKYPGVLDFELEAVAAGLTSGVLVDLNSLIADLASQGFVASASGEPLNRAALDAGISQVAAVSDETSAVPRLLLALGKERAVRGRVYVPDPTWGDASLDSLQFLLLTLGLPGVEQVNAGDVGRGREIASAGFTLADSLIGSRVAFVPPFVAAEDTGVNWLSGLLNVAFPGALEAQKFAVCSAAWVGHAQLRLQASPFAVWHQNGRQPERTQLIGQLTFDKQYETRESAILGLAGCPPPGAGGIPGKTVEWTPGPAAQKHGSLADQTFLTDSVGTVKATYLTVGETAPEDQQVPANEHTEFVLVSLQVLDLLSAFPNTLMVQRAVFGRTGDSANPSDGMAFGVHWYALPTYTAELKVDIRIVGTGILGTAVAQGTIPLTFVPAQESPTGELELTGMDVGELAWTTTPGELVECGETTVEGNGTLGAFVPGGSINATMTGARIRFVPDARADNETYHIPPCEDFGGFDFGNNAWWTGLFTASHLDDMNPSGGIEITGWSFAGADPTTGVIEAQRTYPENCAGECTGESTFTLTLTPVK